MKLHFLVLIAAATALIMGGAGNQHNDAMASHGNYVPDPPSSLKAVPGNNQVILSWSAPDDEGIDPTEYYTIFYKIKSSDGSTSQWHQANNSSRTTTTVTGLANGTNYEFRVAAVNADGRGPWATTSATPGIPSAPTVSVIGTGAGQITLSWTVPDSGGSAISDYIIQYRRGSNSFTTFNDEKSVLTTVTVTGLADNVKYDFRVLARNQANEGEWSKLVSATTPIIPSAPRELTATPENRQVTLTWKDPANIGNSAVTDYIVQYRKGTEKFKIYDDGTGTDNTATITDLDNGATYSFRVAAVNNEGRGHWSTTSVIPHGPSVPTSLVAKSENEQITLTWKAPSHTGISPITGYTVEYKRTSASVWTTFNDSNTTDTTATVTELDNGVPYDFRVAAISNAGTGNWLVKNDVIPMTKPEAPSNLTASYSNNVISLNWNTPNDGGSPITKYIIKFTAHKLFGIGDSGTREVNQVLTSSGLNTPTSYEFQNPFARHTYYFEVQAENASGKGPWSNTVRVYASGF